MTDLERNQAYFLEATNGWRHGVDTDTLLWAVQLLLHEVGLRAFRMKKKLTPRINETTKNARSP
jgi:hypothetical protein